MGRQRWMFAFMGMAIAASSFAQVGGGGGGANHDPGVFIPSGAPTALQPNYFSGTLNTVSASVYAYPAPPGPPQEVYLTWVKMSIGGLQIGGFTEVATWTWNPNLEKTVTAGVSCTFDSTHFSDGDDLHITVTANDNLGRQQSYNGNMIKPVKNKALLGQHSFNIITGIAYDNVQEALSLVAGTEGVGKYRIVVKAYANFDFDPWKGEIGGANFIYAVTHGVQDKYQLETIDLENPRFMTDFAAVLPEDTHKYLLMQTVGESFPNGTYPPYNTSGVPPPSFVFLDSCETFLADFSWVLYPKVNLFDGSGVPRTRNMFAAGWKVLTRVFDAEIFADVLMGKLITGWPAMRALELSMNEWITMGLDTANGVPLDITMVGWHGDEFTKIAGVYTGDNTQTLSWYR